MADEQLTGEQAGQLSPGRELMAAKCLTVARCSEEMALQIEMAADGLKGAQEPLRLFRRFDTLHGSLATTGRLV